MFSPFGPPSPNLLSTPGRQQGFRVLHHTLGLPSFLTPQNLFPLDSPKAGSPRHRLSSPFPETSSTFRKTFFLPLCYVMDLLLYVSNFRLLCSQQSERSFFTPRSPFFSSGEPPVRDSTLVLPPIAIPGTFCAARTTLSSILPCLPGSL